MMLLLGVAASLIDREQRKPQTTTAPENLEQQLMRSPQLLHQYDSSLVQCGQLSPPKRTSTKCRYKACSIQEWLEARPSSCMAVEEYDRAVECAPAVVYMFFYIKYHGQLLL
mgnify:CR=1 FL=1